MPHEIETAVSNAGGRLGIFAGRVRWHEAVGSTNDIVLAWAERGGEEGLVAGADAQSRGRGRLGRTWASPMGVGIYASVLLRPGERVAPLLTLAAGVAVAEGIQASTGFRVALKWPNDLCVSSPSGHWLKLGGILAEAGASASGLGHVVIGVGLNVMPGSYPADVAVRATSLESELGRAVDRGAVLVEWLAALSCWYERLKAGDTAKLCVRWREYARATLGRPVSWNRANQLVTGVAEDIDDSGALMIRASAGVHRVIAGEVTWL